MDWIGLDWIDITAKEQGKIHTPFNRTSSYDPVNEVNAISSLRNFGAKVEMIESTSTLRIERPAWFIFSFLSEIERSPIWEQFEMRAIKITPGEVSKGTEFHLVHKNYERTLLVTEFEKDRLVGAKTVEPSAPKVDLRFRLQPEGDLQTLLNVEWKLETGTPALLERLVAGKIKSAVSDAIDQVRELLETGSITLDDGSEIQLPNE